MTNDYEILCILNNQEPLFKTSLDKIHSILSEMGINIQKETDMGIRELAYEIRKHKEGRYYLFIVNTEPQLIFNLEKELRLREDIIRFIIIKKLFKKARKKKKKKQSSLEV